MDERFYSTPPIILYPRMQERARAHNAVGISVNAVDYIPCIFLGDMHDNLTAIMDIVFTAQDLKARGATTLKPLLFNEKLP